MHTPATLSAPVEDTLSNHSSTAAGMSDIAQQQAANGSNPWLLRPGQETAGQQTLYPQGLGPWLARPVHAQANPAAGVAPAESATAGRTESGGWTPVIGVKQRPRADPVCTACLPRGSPVGRRRDRGIRADE